MKHFILFVLIAVFLAACQPSVEDQIKLLNAQREDKAAAIQQQWDQAKADVQATQQAELELARLKAAQNLKTEQDLNKLKLQFAQDMNDLNATYQGRLNELQADIAAKIAAIQAGTTKTNADAQAYVIGTIALGASLAIGVAGIAIAVARIANALVIWVKNRAKQVNAHAAYKDGNTIYQPSKSLTPYMEAEHMPAIFRWLMWLDFYRSTRKMPAGERWQVTKDAREATQTRFASPQIDSPETVLRLQAEHERTEQVRAVAGMMSKADAQEFVQQIMTAPAPQPVPPVPEIGFLPSLDPDAYQILESAMEDRR